MILTIYIPLIDTLPQSWATLKADAEEARAHAGRLAMEAERNRQAEEEAQRQSSLLEEALETLRSGDNPHLSLHQLQMLHRLPLESILSLQAQLCSCLHTVEQVRNTSPMTHPTAILKVFVRNVSIIIHRSYYVGFFLVYVIFLD